MRSNCSRQQNRRSETAPLPLPLDYTLIGFRLSISSLPSSMFRFLLKAIACSALIATDVLAEDFVPQFLVTHCTDCHGGTDPEANLPLDVVSTDFTIATTADTWQRVLEQITLGQMPPVSSEQPDADEAARLKAWIRSKLCLLYTSPSPRD